MEKFLDRSEILILGSVGVEPELLNITSTVKWFSICSSLSETISSVKSIGFSKSILLGLNVVLSSLLILVLSLNTGDCLWVLKIILNGAIVDK